MRRNSIKVARSILGYLVVLPAGFAILWWTLSVLNALSPTLVVIYWAIFVIWGLLGCYIYVRRLWRDYQVWLELTSITEKRTLKDGEVLIPGGLIEIPISNGRKIVNLSDLSKKRLRKILNENNL
jgi:hypothetical protein